MNWEAIGAIGETVGAFAVVVSLIYLAMQLRAQNKESRLRSVHEIMEAFRTSMAILEEKEQADIFLRGTESYGDLDDVEKMQYIAISQQFMRVWEEAFHTHQANRLPPHSWQAIDRQFARWIGTSGAQSLMKLRGAGFSEEFRDYLDKCERLEYRIK